ncbi:hypothetical protein HK405_010278, partial [Cladochytrium tenue]
MQLIFDPSDPWNPKINSSTTVQLQIPAAFSQLSMQFTGAGTSLTIAGPDGVSAAVLTVADYSTAASGSSATSQVILPLLPSHGDHLSVATTQSAFANFFTQATTTSGDFKLTMSGYADTEAVATQSGSSDSVDLCLKYVSLSASVTLTGLGGLQDASISKPSVLGGSSSTGIQLSIPLTIKSPSSNLLLVSNTDAEFDMQYQGSTVGTIVVPSLSISPGTNSYTATGYVNPDTTNSGAVSATRALLTAFTGGTTVQVSVTNGRASNMASLDAAFNAVTLTQSLPPNTTPLIVSASFTFPNILTLKATANLVAQNPFAADVSITQVTSTLTYNGMTVGTVDQDVSGFTIPANGQATSPDLTLSVDLDLSAIELLLSELGGGPIGVDTVSSLTIDFGGYSTTIDYTQAKVPTTLSLTRIDATTTMKRPSRSHLSAIGSLAVAALAAVASPASVAALYCTEGVVSGSLCLTNCATGIGIDVEAPQLITGIDVGQFQVIFDPSDPWHPKVHSTTTVQLTLPDNFKQLDLSFFGAGANLTIWAEGLPVATLGVADYRNVTGSSASSSVVLPLSPEAGDHLSPSSVTGYAGFEAFFE